MAVPYRVIEKRLNIDQETFDGIVSDDGAKQEICEALLSCLDVGGRLAEIAAMTLQYIVEMAVNKDEETDDVDWITVNGNHIPVDPDSGEALGGQFKALGKETGTLQSKIEGVKDRMSAETGAPSMEDDMHRQGYTKNAEGHWVKTGKPAGISTGPEMKPKHKYKVVDGDGGAIDMQDFIRENLDELKAVYEEAEERGGDGGDAVDLEYWKALTEHASGDIYEIDARPGDIKSDFIEIVGDNYLAQWFVQEDPQYKPIIIRNMLSSPEARNMALNMMYVNYKDWLEFEGDNSKPMSFEEFVTTPIKLYRGGSGKAHKEATTFSAYTMSRKTAEKFLPHDGSGQIYEFEIRPIDTWGGWIRGTEYEVMVPYWMAPNGNKDSVDTNRCDAAHDMGSVGVLVVSGGKILVGKRASGHEWPGYLCGPGGKVEDGETFRDAAVRETEEEFGITPEELIFIGYGVDAEKPERKNAQFLCTGYKGMVKCKDGEMDRPVFVTLDALAKRKEELFPSFAYSLDVLVKKVGADDGEIFYRYDDEDWVTIKGTHVLLNENGEALSGGKLKGMTFANAKSVRRKSKAPGGEGPGQAAGAETKGEQGAPKSAARPAMTAEEAANMRDRYKKDAKQIQKYEYDVNYCVQRIKDYEKNVEESRRDLENCQLKNRQDNPENKTDDELREEYNQLAGKYNKLFGERAELQNAFREQRRRGHEPTDEEFERYQQQKNSLTENIDSCIAEMEKIDKKRQTLRELKTAQKYFDWNSDRLEKMKQAKADAEKRLSDLKAQVDADYAAYNEYAAARNAETLKKFPTAEHCHMTDEVTDYLRAKGYFKGDAIEVDSNVDLTGVQAVHAVNLADRIEVICEEIPAVMGQLGGIRGYDPGDEPAHKNAYAYANYNDKKVSLNLKWWGSDDIERSYEKSKDIGFHPRLTSYWHMLDHEYTHVIEAMLNEKLGGRKNAANIIMRRAMKRWTGDKYNKELEGSFREMVSGYAARNMGTETTASGRLKYPEYGRNAEFLAEAVAAGRARSEYSGKGVRGTTYTADSDFCVCVYEEFKNLVKEVLG